MAAIAPVTAVPGGATVTPASAAGGGDTFVNNGKTLFRVTNGGGSSVTVTFTAQNNYTMDGITLSSTNIAVAVAAGATKVCGPFPPQIFNNSSGIVTVSYSAATSVTVEALTS